MESIKELHGRQVSGVLTSDSDEDEAEFLLGDNVSQRNWIDDGSAISLDSVTIALPDDPNCVLIHSSASFFGSFLQFLFRSLLANNTEKEYSDNGRK